MKFIISKRESSRDYSITTIFLQPMIAPCGITYWIATPSRGSGTLLFVVSERCVSEKQKRQRKYFHIHLMGLFIKVKGTLVFLKKV